MTVADGSQVRLADVSEVTIGTIPATPAFQVMRYVTADVRIAKQVDVPDEVRPDRNSSAPVDVGRSVTGSINTLLSYGTYDTWLERLFASSWSTNVLKNGITHKAGALEMTFEQGASDSYIRYRACRWNTLALSLRPRASVSANWGIMGIDSPTPTAAILTGATYAPPTVTEVFNAGLNVAALDFTGIATPPVIQSLDLNLTNNIYAVDAVGSYAPDSLGLGGFRVTGSLTALFKDMATYQAILDHSDVTIGFTLTDAAGNSYQFAVPKTKLIDGGPSAPGNGRPAILTVPFQAYYDSDSSATITLTRTPAA